MDALWLAAEVGIGVVIGYAAGPWLEREQKAREADLELLQPGEGLVVGRDLSG